MSEKKEIEQFENFKTEILAMIESGSITVGALGLSEESANFIHDFSFTDIRTETAREIINELESNPNQDGSQSPNIHHWIENKQLQLKQKYNINNK